MRVVFLTHNYPRWPGDLSGAALGTLARACWCAGAYRCAWWRWVRTLPRSTEQDGIPIRAVLGPPAGSDDLRSGRLCRPAQEPSPMGASAAALAPAEACGRTRSVRWSRSGARPLVDAIWLGHSGPGSPSAHTSGHQRQLDSKLAAGSSCCPASFSVGLPWLPRSPVPSARRFEPDGQLCRNRARPCPAHRESRATLDSGWLRGCGDGPTG